MSSPAQPRRRFVSWERPLPVQAVELLAQGWSGPGPLDLSDQLVIVSTRQSGRRLREALAAHAAAQGAAVFPPRVLLPEALLSPPGNVRVATRLESLLGWIEVVSELKLDRYRAVFPVDPPVRQFGWSLRLAQQFVRLQRTLAESGLRLADVAGRIGADAEEAERWSQMGELERRLDAVLAQWGCQDAPAARIAQARMPALPEGVRRVTLLAVPDPQPLAVEALRVLADRLPVDVVVFAPAREAESFDAWGRPRPEAWDRRSLDLPEFADRVHLCADPAAQGAQVADLARQYPTPGAALGIGVADADVLPMLEHALAQAGLAAFNPEGRTRRGDALHTLLAALARVAREPSFAAAETLARCPDVLQCLHARFDPGFSSARFLAALDDLHAAHLPPTLAEARRQAAGRADASADGVAAGLAVLDELGSALRAGRFPENVVTVLGEIFRSRRFDLSQPDDAIAGESAEPWMGILREIRRLADLVSRIGNAEWWELALQLYGESVRYPEKPDGALELHGWLELLWEDAPHLVVVGCNDGKVPEAVVGDPFLPESLRTRLGLKTNAARFARDAYLLQAIAALRNGGGRGRIDVLLGKASAAGDPLRPSRLLLRCPEAELADRVAFLFRAAESERSAPAWRRAWQLSPGEVRPPERVAVTGFRAWLDCPFRFYLGRVRRMTPVDPAKTELDVFDFGTLCHAALEAMGREPALRDETSAAVLREFLVERLHTEARRRFGADLTLPLLVQLESARQRLSRAAEIQAASRADGWVIEAVERAFALPLDGLIVQGKIDRIDRHEGSGLWRVLDYKTSDKPVSPRLAHVRSARREGETAPDFARFQEEGRERVWVDLQLPLYLRAVAGDPALALAGREVGCAYFNLPKAVGETAIAPWSDYTPALDEAAGRCAAGVVAAIRAGRFWPPNEEIAPERDDFGSLFHRGVAASVAWPGGAPAGREEPGA